jgi:hypothetical protein
MSTEPKPGTPRPEEMIDGVARVPLDVLSIEASDADPLMRLPEHGPVRTYLEQQLNTLAGLQLDIAESESPGERAGALDECTQTEREIQMIRRFDEEFRVYKQGATTTNRQAASLAELAMILKLRKEDRADTLERMAATTRIKNLYALEEDTPSAGPEASSAD